jgi:hypothetical protein
VFHVILQRLSGLCTNFGIITQKPSHLQSNVTAFKIISQFVKTGYLCMGGSVNSNLNVP